MIFPPPAYDAVFSSPSAAAAVATMIYVGAVADESDEPVTEHIWARPSMVVWMSDETLSHTIDNERTTWARAALRSKKSVVRLLTDWGIAHTPWYEADSRETVRDDTWRKWKNLGAIRKRAGVKTNDSGPRWALGASFADLFDPGIPADDFQVLVMRWQSSHLSRGDMLRIQHLNDLGKARHHVPVVIPGHGVRNLEPGVASEIIKGVVEQWATQRLRAPMVVAISEPGAKLWIVDAAKLAAAKISINVSTVLPDAIILETGTNPPTFWLVEAVATDGEINEDRKSALLQWASDQYIDPKTCQFLTAFTSRSSPQARKRLKDIAVDTYCWFLDEPDRELSWSEIVSG